MVIFPSPLINRLVKLKIGFCHGTAKDIHEADQASQTHKGIRTARGQRAERKAVPPGVFRRERGSDSWDVYREGVLPNTEEVGSPSQDNVTTVPANQQESVLPGTTTQKPNVSEYYLDKSGDYITVEKGPSGNFSFWRKKPGKLKQKGQRLMMRPSRWFPTREEALESLAEYAEQRGFTPYELTEEDTKPQIKPGRKPPTPEERQAEKNKERSTTGRYWNGLPRAEREKLALLAGENDQGAEYASEFLWAQFSDHTREKLEGVVAEAQGSVGKKKPIKRQQGKKTIDEEINTVSANDLDAMLGIESEPGEQNAADIAKKAAAAGVKGASEALTGLYELFGGSSLKSFPAGLDKDTYAKAKPHFEAALVNFRESGQSLKELLDFLVKNMSDKVRPYLKHWVMERKEGARQTKKKPVSRVKVDDILRLQWGYKKGHKMATSTGEKVIDFVDREGVHIEGGEVLSWGYVNPRVYSDKNFDKMIDVLEGESVSQPEADATPEIEPGVSEQDFRGDLEKKGAARDSRGVDYKILQVDKGGSFYYQSTEDGVRLDKGPGYPARWSREKAISKAVSDAHLTEVGQTNADSDIIEVGGKNDDQRNARRPSDTGRHDATGSHEVATVPQREGTDNGSGKPDRKRSGAGAPGGPGVREGRTESEGGVDGSKGHHVPEKPNPTEPDGRSAGNYLLTEEEVNAIGKRSETQRIKDNFQAIDILKALQVNGRKATSAEQSALARYSGWGGLSGVFNKRSIRLEKQREELEKLLTQEEFEAARSSSRTAFYTAPVVVTKLYDAMSRLGVRGGGKMIEPSVGTGNFLGLMPSRFRAGTQITGVELDTITGGIAKALYPDANIAAPLGFQDITLTPGSFDFAIGNPPFLNRPLKDKGKFNPKGPDGKPLKQNVHNFFFSKTIHALRPGGVMGMIVSHGLMDKADSIDRMHIARHAELLGAVRLPDTAFLGNTGTSVVTDILFFKKRESPLSWTEVENEGWTQSVEHPIAEGEPVHISKYFADNPDMMLGEMTRGGTMYGPNEPTLKAQEGQDIAEALDGAIANLPANVFEKRAGQQVEQAKRDLDIPYGTKINAYFVGKDGTLRQRENDHEGYQVSGPATRWHVTDSVEVPLADAQVKRATAMLKVRDSLNALIKAEQQEEAKDAELSALRGKLNRDYDLFVKKFGRMHDMGSGQAFSADPDYPRLLALEVALATHGPKVTENIVQASGAKRKGLNAAQRLLVRKVFYGKVQPGQKYIIADDILTQGGTVNELRHYIENNGGEVVGITSLAFSAGSNIIAIKEDTVSDLIKRFGREQLEKTLLEYNIAGTIKALTESEGRAIARFTSRPLESFRTRLAAERSQFLSSLHDEGERRSYRLRSDHPDTLPPPPLCPGRHHSRA